MIKFCTPKSERTGLMELKRAKWKQKTEIKQETNRAIWCWLVIFIALGLVIKNMKNVGKELYTT